MQRFKAFVTPHGPRFWDVLGRGSVAVRIKNPHLKDLDDREVFQEYQGITEKAFETRWLKNAYYWDNRFQTKYCIAHTSLQKLDADNILVESFMMKNMLPIFKGYPTRNFINHERKTFSLDHQVHSMIRNYSISVEHKIYEVNDQGRIIYVHHNDGIFYAEDCLGGNIIETYLDHQLESMCNTSGRLITTRKYYYFNDWNWTRWEFDVIGQKCYATMYPKYLEHIKIPSFITECMNINKITVQDIIITHCNVGRK